MKIANSDSTIEYLAEETSADNWFMNLAMGIMLMGMVGAGTMGAIELCTPEKREFRMPPIPNPNDKKKKLLDIRTWLN